MHRRRSVHIAIESIHDGRLNPLEKGSQYFNCIAKFKHVRAKKSSGVVEYDLEEIALRLCAFRGFTGTAQTLTRSFGR
jgi:hypothetical protein